LKIKKTRYKLQCIPSWLCIDFDLAALLRGVKFDGTVASLSVCLTLNSHIIVQLHCSMTSSQQIVKYNLLSMPRFFHRSGTGKAQ